MRIIGGQYRHRIIKYPFAGTTRPTKDMVREALFSALLLDLANARVLDLFAGSGAYGIEAISRGAVKAVFVDNNIEAIKCIKDNLLILGIKEAEVYERDYLTAIKELGLHKEEFDIVFLDPPYAMKNYQEIICLLEEYALLAKNGIIICESDAEIYFGEGQFSKIKKYHYGKTYIQILRR